MKIYLAGGNGKAEIINAIRESRENEYYVGVKETIGGKADAIRDHKPFILESYYYMDEKIKKLIPYFGDFLLDSGAFTIMDGGVTVDWDEYTTKYAEFVKNNNISKFMELDIDNIIGYEKVKRYRATLERLAGRQAIPVWHKERGIDEYKGAAKDYPYIALGGLVRSDYDRLPDRVIPRLIDIAHKSGAKIHGLGYTRLNGLTVNHFDSVDSTAWTTGNRFGHLFRFNGKTITKIDKPAGMRVNTRAAAMNNYIEWVKFQRYADTHL